MTAVGAITALLPNLSRLVEEYAACCWCDDVATFLEAHLHRVTTMWFVRKGESPRIHVRLWLNEKDRSWTAVDVDARGWDGRRDVALCKTLPDLVAFWHSMASQTRKAVINTNGVSEDATKTLDCYHTFVGLDAALYDTPQLQFPKASYEDDSCYAFQ